MTGPLPLTPGRRAALIIGVPLVLLIISWGALTTVAFAGQASYPVNLRVPVHGGTVTLGVDSGDVNLGPGGGSEVRVRGTAHYSLFRSTVSWQRTPSGVAIRSDCHQITGVCWFRYTATMPGRLNADISSSSGNLAVHDLTGQVSLAADSGDILVSALTGGARIQTSSGNITGAGLAGGQVLLMADSGDISVTGLRSPHVTVTAHSGNVILVFATVPANVSVRSNSGDIRLVLPPGSTAYRVSAHTSSGSTSVRVPTNAASAHMITVTAASGNVTVTQ